MQVSIALAALLPIFSAKLALADADNCPGVLNVEYPSLTGCCVGAAPQSVVVSSCPGWPICTGLATTSMNISPLSCATCILLTADNYNSLVASASRSLQQSGTNDWTTIGQGTICSNPTMTSGQLQALLGQVDPLVAILQSSLGHLQAPLRQALQQAAALQCQQMEVARWPDPRL
jgi:hypothetical protein